MELINATRMIAGYTIGIDPSGRESLVVVVKGTFRIPGPGLPLDHVELHDVQRSLVMADTFTGAPGFSAPVHEVDFAPEKKKCDLLLLGTAYAPRGRPATRVEVEVRIGPSWRKTFAVVGPRHWECGISHVAATPPGAFVRQSISYDVAFGGTDANAEDISLHAAFLPNPVGRGFFRNIDRRWVEGAPLPSTEEQGHPVLVPDGDYRPMSFGPVGRGWETRVRLAGTYDDEWLEKHFPFLPPDFDPLYFQAAPPDQQLPLAMFKNGPCDISLANLTPDSVARFTIPHLQAPVHVFPKHGACEDFIASLDTIVIEPDHQRFTLTWRVARPLKKNLFEIAQVLVGRREPLWWNQREVLAMPGSRSALDFQLADSP